jgi:hypothetical protein
MNPDTSMVDTREQAEDDSRRWLEAEEKLLAQHR